jgi:hypothetical protein
LLAIPAQAFVDVNVTGTLNLLEAAAAAGHDRFVFTSTTSLMITEAISAGPRAERGRSPGWTRASRPLEPRNIYGVTKHAAEQFVPPRPPPHRHGRDGAADEPLLPEDDDTHAQPAATTSRPTSSCTGG